MTASRSTTTAPPGPVGSAPENAQLVLLSLILVAAVANLNLSVANVALPSIGAAFDASQTALDLVAVGYSLGLAASVLWLGALGDRYGRKLMLILGVLLSIPACLVAAFAPTIEVLIVARIVGGVSAGMAYPTTLALIAALWSGPGRTRSIALWSALGGAIAALGSARLRLPARALRVGLGLPRHAAARRGRAGDGGPFRAQPRERDDRAGRQPRRHPVGGARRRGDPGDQLRAGPGRGHPRARPVRDRRCRRRSPSSSASGGRRTRCTTSTIAGRRIFWVAACAGIIVFGSLMGAMFIGQQYPPERPRLLDAGRRRGDHPGRPVHGHRGAAVGQARRGPRRPLHAARSATCSCLLGFATMLAAVGRGQPVLAGRARATPSSGSASGSPARRPRTR